jgi:hypothetical protein
MIVRLDFDGDESYQSGPGPAHFLGSDFGYGNLEGYRISEDGLVILDFGDNRFVKIPVRRLLRITEK